MIFGKQIRLRPVERDDLPRFVQWFADPEVRDGLALFVPMSLAEEEMWFNDLLKRDRLERPFAIDAKTADGWVHIGSAGYHKIDWKNRNAEIGIAIGDKGYWNNGYGTDTMQTVVAFGFAELNLEHIYLKVFEFNPRAIRCYEKAGFRHEGRLRHDRFRHNGYYDTLWMGILRGEWESEKA